MGLGSWWQRWVSRGEDLDRPPKGPKSVNIFLGFFFIVNFCLGTGFLGIPYAFFHTGLPAAIATLLIIAFVSWNNATWEVEVMARAQAVASLKNSTSNSVTEDTDETSKNAFISEKTPEIFQKDDSGHPKYEILLTRKFEPTELCEIFFNRWMKYLYLLVMTVYIFLTGWSYSTVAGSAWASNIPFHTSSLQQCSGSDFHNNLIPENEGCASAYRFCLFLFGVVVIPFSLVDLSEQAFVQMILGFMRFFTVGAIVLYTIVRLAQDGNACIGSSPFDNVTNNTMEDEMYANLFNPSNTSQYFNLSNVTSYFDRERDFVYGFNVKGWLVAIPVFTYAFIIHQGIPALTHPIKQKEYLRWLMVTMFGISAFCYLTLGVTASLWFSASVQETVTLNWVDFSAPGNSPQLRALSYYLILFPSLDVTSAYPLVVHTIVNNIYMVLMGHDTTEKPKYSCDCAIRLTLKFLAAALPIVAALFVSNLVYVLKYAGLIGFGMCFFFPTLLQLQSQRVCKRVFGPLFLLAQEANSQQEGRTGGKGRAEKESTPLLSNQDEGGVKGRAVYMTPYSGRVLSHPVTVVIIGSVGVVLFVLAIAGLAMHPSEVTCQA